MSLLRLMIFLGILNFGSAPLVALDTGEMAIQAAASEDKSLFIFFYKDLNDRTLKLQQIFDTALTRLNGQANSIKINVNNPSEKATIDRFNLKRSPMPFVLVLAPNGAITGGFPSFTKEKLIDSMASPGTAKCLKALQDHKLVLLCLQNGQTTYVDETLKGIKDFKEDSRFAEATEIVMIDPSNIQEHQFLKQLDLDLHSSQAITVLISPPGEIIGTYKGSITKMQLIEDLQQATSGCCGPGGCCPGGKCGTKK